MRWLVFSWCLAMSSVASAHPHEGDDEMTEIRTSIRLTSHPDGYRISGMKRSDDMLRAGVKNGDVLERLNGEWAVLLTEREVYSGLAELVGERLSILRSGVHVQLGKSEAQ